MFFPNKPQYGFFSTGDKTAYYTLRLMYDGWYFVEGQEIAGRRAYHVQNLSTDRNEALVKANNICSALNIPFDASLYLDLNEIKRINDEAEREAIASQRAEVAKREQTVREQHLAELVKTRMLNFGKYAGRSFDEVSETDPDYVRYIANASLDGKPEFTAGVMMAKVWVAENPLVVSSWIGKEGDIVESQFKVTKKAWFRGSYGDSLLTVLMDAVGNIAKVYSTAKAVRELSEGDVITMKATVKKNDWDGYRGVNDQVSILSKPKVV